MVRLHVRGGGMSGIYHCEIPDQSGVNQTLYVGLYAITIHESGKRNKCICTFGLSLSRQYAYSMKCAVQNIYVY